LLAPLCDAAAMDFEEALSRLGFSRSDERGFRQGEVELFTAHPNAFMTYSVQAYPDGTAMFTWEFALGDYLAERDIQVGSDEQLNQFMYPRQDLRGAQDGTWLIGAIERTEAQLISVRFDQPSG
jgi:GrpB-like predicted nucleotidyltransferase (UPF0157 family)